ncbi:MAG: hypothetical protein DMG64_00440 [Acidobacteria bacterium]|nr:MAG: hypothetical protein DMG63_14635 [Acidobacteriota bacterium]PYY06766.1 MAG: hypothetical protein DMG64_00440 [Acidobacteriota bacterium]PYY23264.1 MAG: hypothetical protein DMG62_09225 [Acidobacteriota bacterium]
MSTASFSPAVPEMNQQPGLSEPERIMNVFVAPSKTFADIRRSSRWWVPFLLSCIFGYALIFTVGQKVGWEQVTENQMKLNPKAVERMDQLSPEERARRMSFAVAITKGISYAIPVVVLLVDLVIAAVLMATFNFGVGTQITFGQSFAIVMYAWLVGIVRSLLAVITLFAGSNVEAFNFSNPVGTNPAYYMSITDVPGWLYRMCSWFDLITIWLFVLMGIGFAVVGRKKISTGIAVMAGWFIVMVLVTTGWVAVTS